MPTSWTRESLTSNLEALASSYFPASGAIQLVGGVFDKGRTEFFTVGRPGGAYERNADADSIFEIGATTMAFTATLLADMAVRQEIKLHDPVNSYLPAQLRAPTYRGQPITLLDLANHTSGLPRLPTNFLETVQDQTDPCRDYTMTHLSKFLAKHSLRESVGRIPKYSNLGMGLLGHALSAAVGEEYEQAVQKRIALPLGLRDTTIALNSEQQRRLLVGHSSTGEPTACWAMPALPAAGALRSTARELLTFLQSHWDSKGPLYPALELCRTPLSKTGKPTMWIIRYAWALVLCALALGSQQALAVAPGTEWFFVAFFTSVLLSSLQGGLGPGLLTLAGNCVGSSLLWGQQFNAPVHAVSGGLLAWYASASRCAENRPEPLGWQSAQSWFGPLTLWHSGETGGYASFIAIRPELGLGVVLLSNCARSLTGPGFSVLKHVT